MSERLEERLRRAAQTYRRLGNHSAESMLLDAADTILELRDDLQRAYRDNAKLREQMERLVTLLRVDCDIDASWDGLRRFWSIGLTEDGCLMRDRACKAEADNAKLRELARDMWEGYNDPRCEECHLKDAPTCADCPICAREAAVIDHMRELGIEVDG